MEVAPTDVDIVAPSPTPVFPFLLLPAELRNQIYALSLQVPQVIDLDPTNYRVLAPRLLLLLTSRQVHDEAYPVFYGENTFRLFPIHTRFYYTDRPLLARLPLRYLEVIKTLDIRLGCPHNIPFRAWAVTPNLRLSKATNIRVLKVFVESEPTYTPYERRNNTGNHPYTDMAGRIVKSIFDQSAGLEEVILDGFPRVDKVVRLHNPSPLFSRLLEEAGLAEKKITWGLLRGWKAGNGYVQIDETTTDRDNKWAMVDLYGDESLDRLLGLLVMT